MARKRPDPGQIELWPSTPRVTGRRPRAGAKTGSGSRPAGPPAADPPELGSRITGGLLGLACGDALGAPIEFQSSAAVRKRHGTVTEMIGGGSWAPGEWTDDSGMALCIAEGILDDPADPVPGTGERFLAWWPTAKDVGGTISAALAGFRTIGDWVQASSNTHQARTGKAAGNGSLMRTLPVALAYADVGIMLTQSARLSAMTHWDPQAEVCCAIYCLWIRELLGGAARDAGWHRALREARRYAQTGPLAPAAPDTPGPQPLPEDFWSRFEDLARLSYTDLQPSGYAGYSVECLEAAAWCALYAEDAEQAIVDVVNLAGEADTMGAVTGGAVGVYWGVEALPSRWLAKLHQRQRIEKIAQQLAELREKP